jgi:hypothetical protein
MYSSIYIAPESVINELAVTVMILACRVDHEGLKRYLK